MRSEEEIRDKLEEYKKKANRLSGDSQFREFYGTQILILQWVLEDE